MKPYKRRGRLQWYVDIDRKTYPLGTNQAEAFAKFADLIKGKLPANDKTPITTIIERYLAWVADNLKPATHTGYKSHLDKFVKVAKGLTVATIKRHHIVDHVDKAYKGQSTTYQHNAYVALSACFNWAINRELMVTNPVKGAKRPKAKTRAVYLKPEQWTALVAAVKPTDPFADLIHFMYETGVRTKEARIVAARHWDRKTHLVLDIDESKGETEQRVIRLNERAREIVKRLALKHPDGPLLRNKIGKPWRKNTVVCRCDKLSERLGFRLKAYYLRHTFATNALIRGVDPMVVGKLMGHKDASMVYKVYGHHTDDEELLAKKLDQATDAA